MEPLTLAVVALGCCFGSALLGIYLHHRPPGRHLDAERV